MKNHLILFVLFCTVIACNNTAEKIHTGSGISIENDTCKQIDNYLTILSKDNNFSGGLLIIKNEKKIFSKGYGWADAEKKIPFTSTTLGSIGSITKAFTAAAILKLVEQNKLLLEDPLKKYFPEIPDDKSAITIHQLLTHSSGFHEFLKNDGGDYEVLKTEEFLERAFGEPLAFKPGEKAVYTNVGMSILGIIIEKISGQDYELFLRTQLLEPIGVKRIGYHYPMAKNDTIAVGYENGKKWGTHQERFEQAGGGPYWNIKANGGLEASLDEMFIWMNSFTNHTVLKQTSIEKMFTTQIEEDGSQGQYFFGYGCNISKSKRNTKVISNGGSNGIYFARIVRYPEEGLVFYMITNESAMNTNMVLPNVLQMYFNGKIEDDATQQKMKFNNELSEKLYDILIKSSSPDLKSELAKHNLKIDDDMILLEVGQTLISENSKEKAIILYEYYTKTFPKIVVAWNDLGDLYQAKGRIHEAKNCFRQALIIRPENQRARESLEKLK